ncbi:DUF3352 domain-containing protein [Leptolyngbya sp. PCC 6406]|uniref:DUF3352 domain-containing protein n=1 Tax=Leptolyngbya sp. PCC 6406 TaxID=1173264 RepID=UPI0002ABEDD6|nr:DUF3352 domain-containing protein [Leptolyngbya sp. PCC 6406]
MALNFVRRTLLVGAIAPTLAFPTLAANTAMAPLGRSLTIARSDPALELPADVAYVALLDTRPETWQRLEQYLLFEQISAETGDSPNPGVLPFLPPELDYSSAIAPWVGETVAIALLPLPQPQAVEMADHLVMLAPIDNADTFAAFLGEIASLRPDAPEVQSYGDVEIQYWAPQYFDAEHNGDAESRPDPSPPKLEEEPEPVSPTVPNGTVPNGTDSNGTDSSSPSPEVKGNRPNPLNQIFTKALPDIGFPDIALPVPETPIPDLPAMAIAVVADYLVVAESPAAIRHWLDQRPQDADMALATDPRFQRTVENPRYDTALGTLHGNLAELVNYALVETPFSGLAGPLALPPLLGDLSPAEIARLAALQLDSGLEIFIYPQAEGLRLQGRVYYDNSPLLRQFPQFLSPANPEVLNQVPAATYLIVSGQNLAGLWATVATALEQNEDLSIFLNLGRGLFQAFTGLSLDEDVFRWMEGGFTLFLFPTRNTPLVLFDPALEVGLGMVVQTRDGQGPVGDHRAAAEAMFAKLDQHFGADFLSVESQQINGQPASIWHLPGETNPAISLLGHGWADDNTAVITLGGGSLEPILTLSERQTLAGAPLFRRATRGFPTPNQGYVYANISATLSFVFNGLGIADDSEAPISPGRRWLGSIPAVSSSFSVGAEAIQLDGLMVLTPSRPER